MRPVVTGRGPNRKPKFMPFRNSTASGLLAVLLAALAQQAGAQTLDEVTLAFQGEDVVARVSFMGPVRFVQQTPLVPAQFFQLQVELLAPDEASLNQRVSESRHLAGDGPIPEVSLELSPTPNSRVRQITLELGDLVQLRARQGANPKSIDIVFVGRGKAPVAQVPIGAPVPPQPVAAAGVEVQAGDLMAQARDAVSKGNTETAIALLNRLLLLPPNSSSQDAQEMIGLAWERSGDLTLARTEYQLYLKLFPSGEGAQRVLQRLASMGQLPERPERATDAGPKRSETRYTGNLAQYYFGGKTRSQSLVNLDGGIDQSTLTKTTESALVTNVDLGARYTTDETDIRAVLRGTGSTNLAKTSKNVSTLNSAYVDYKQKESGLALRVGRQSAINGGLLGMFDGVSMTYPLRGGVRVNLMGGAPANALVAAPAERLFAGMVEADAIVENLSGDLYLLDQTTQGITNRRALGAEARYSNERGSLYTLLDYDTLFRALNAITLQASVQGPGQTTYTLLVDNRKAPTYQLTNALISTGAASLKLLLQQQSLVDAMTAARQTSAQARQFMFSASRPLNEKWQASGDFRFSEIGALPAVGTFEATPATGAQYGFSAQLTGSNIYSKRDINNFNMSLMSTPMFRGVQLAYNNLTGFEDNKLTLEPSIRFYAQRDAQGSTMRRVSPGLRASYNVSKKMSVMGEGLLERSSNQGLTNHDTTNSVFFYFGVRYELF